MSYVFKTWSEEYQSFVYLSIDTRFGSWSPVTNRTGIDSWFILKTSQSSPRRPVRSGQVLADDLGWVGRFSPLMPWEICFSTATFAPSFGLSDRLSYAGIMKNRVIDSACFSEQ